MMLSKGSVDVRRGSTGRGIGWGYNVKLSDGNQPSTTLDPSGSEPTGCDSPDRFHRHCAMNGSLRNIHTRRQMRLMVVIPPFARASPDICPGVFHVRIAKNAVGPAVMVRAGQGPRINRVRVIVAVAVVVNCRI